MKKSGFTLIELIFVIVIIGLLAAVAVPKFLATKKNAETANFPEVANQIVTKATEQYNLIGESNLNNIIKSDSNIKKYIHDINQTGTHAFHVSDLNSTDLKIVYDNGEANNTCLEIKVEDVKVTINKNNGTVTAKDFNITELNTSCNQD